VLTVTGTAIERAYLERSSIFIECREPIAQTPKLEVYDGGTNFLFYRGVRAAALPATSAFTYNILTPLELSEDRALKSLWDAEYALETTLPTLDSERIASRLVSGTDYWDQYLKFEYCGNPSSAFLAAVKAHASDANLNQSARKVLERHQQNSADFDELDKLTDQQKEILASAFVIARRMGAAIESNDVTVCSTLGAGVYGLFHQSSNRIFISSTALDNGVDHTAATLFEEWVHKHHKAKDHSRHFQDVVLQRFVQVTKEAMAA
jgi:hypothetical protein